LAFGFLFRLRKLISQVMGLNLSSIELRAI